MRRLMAALALVGALIALMPAIGRAETYPNRPIKLIVPFPAGGGGDVLARLITHHMSEDLGQTVVVLNQVGAGGALAFAQGAKAEGDGYTLIWSTVSLPVLAATMDSLNFDPAADFTHIGGLVENPFVFVVNPNVPAKNLAELVAQAKAKPKAINLAHNGTGTLTKLALDLLQLQAGIEITEVSYRGDNFSMADVVAGHVQGMFSNSPVALPNMASGRVRGLAVTSAKRSPSMPDLPTMAEAGVPGFEVSVWHGLSGPAKLPRPVIERLSASMKKALAVPEVRERLKTLGVEPAFSTPEEYDALVKKELALWASVAKRAAQAGK